jgi:hypothetical protein
MFSCDISRLRGKARRGFCGQSVLVLPPKKLMISQLNNSSAGRWKKQASPAVDRTV